LIAATWTSSVPGYQAITGHPIFQVEVAIEMARTRDLAGFADLGAHCKSNPVGKSTTRVAMHRVAALLATKGGVIADITVGDALELLGVAADICEVPHHKSPCEKN
jgi:hypothetical protein